MFHLIIIQTKYNFIMSKMYNDFWDSFNTKKYEEVVESRDDRLEFRINGKTKKKFKEKVEKNGGATKVLTAFIHFINNTK